MFDADNRDRDRRTGPPSSFGASARDDKEHPDGAATWQGTAGTRRGRTQNPLLAALAETNRRHDPEPPAEPAIDDTPVGFAGTRKGGFRTSIRDGAREGLEDTRPEEARSNPAVSAAEDHVAIARDDQIWRPLIDPMKVIVGVADAKLLIVSTTVLGALLGVAVALSTPKKYEAATEILVDPRELQLVGRDLMQGGLPSDATLALVENQARILSSGTVLNKVVDRLNLSQDPEFNGQKNGGIGSIVSDLRSLLSRNDGVSVGDRRHALAVQNLARSLSVERGGKTFVIVVSVKTKEAEKSALIANTMTEVFLQTYGELQSGTAGRAADELSARLDQLRDGVEAAERKVETFKAENDLIDAQGRLITDDEIVRLNEQLTTARARTLELKAKAESSKGVGVEAAIGGTLPEELSSNIITELRSQYAAAKQQADRLSVQLGPRHPQLLAVQAQLSGTREQIAGEMRRIVASTQTELKRAVELEQQLSSRLAQLKVRQGSVSDDLVSLRELERDAAAKRSVYEGFLLRATETGEQKDINTAKMSVISPAFAPLTPLGPSRSMIALTGAFLGFFAGVGIGGARGAWQSLRENTGGRRRTGRSPGSSDTPPPGSPAPSDPARRPSRTAREDYSVHDHEMSANPGLQGKAASSVNPAPRGFQANLAMPRDRFPKRQDFAPSYVHDEPAPDSNVGYQWQPMAPSRDALAQFRQDETDERRTASSIEEIRHSLREFNDAVREFAERRSRRRSA